MDHANILLKNEVYFINEELTCLDLKEKEFLDVHKAFLPYLNQYKTPKIFVLDEHYEERRTDLFKNTI
jgi:nicotinamide riboside kinase